MLTCVKCTSHVTSLGWGVGMLTFMLTCDYLSLPYHAVPRPDPTAMLTQSWCEASGCGSGVGWTPRPKVWWRSQVKPWRIVWQCEWKQNRASFQAQIPCKLQVIVKNHFKIPGILKTILGNESAVSLWRKRHFFSKRSKRWRGFPSGGLFMLADPLPAHKTGVGWGGAITFTYLRTSMMWGHGTFTCTCAHTSCYVEDVLRHAWGGVLWGNNVHVLAHFYDVRPRHVHLHLRTYVMLRWRCLTSRMGWGGLGWGNNVHVLAHFYDVRPRHVHLHLRTYVMLRWRCLTSRMGWGGVGQ